MVSAVGEENYFWKGGGKDSEEQDINEDTIQNCDEPLPTNDNGKYISNNAHQKAGQSQMQSPFVENTGDTSTTQSNNSINDELLTSLSLS